MAIALTLTDGSTTVTLTSTDGQLASYYPAVAPADAESIVESIQVDLINSSATIDATIIKIEKLLEQARNWVRNPDSYSMVYLSLTLDSATWTSPVFDGLVQSTEAMLKHERATGRRGVTLQVEHAPYWEGSETIVLLTNGNGTDQTSLNIYAINDNTGTSPTKLNNYVEIPAAQVTGDTPSPASFLFGKAISAITGITFFIHHAVEIASDLPDIYLEAEDGTGGSDTVNATSSGGEYRPITWAGDAWSKIWYATVPNLSKLKYMDYELLLGLKNPPAATAYFQAKLTSGSTVLWTGPIKKATAQAILSLGIAKIAPSFSPYWGDITLEVYGRQSGGGALDLDFVQISPTESVMRIDGVEFSGVVGADTGLYIDGINDRVTNWKLISPGVRGNIPVEWSGDYVYLVPGKKQRIYFTWGDDTGISSSTHLQSVAISYKPRRRAL